jgi:hypothetical protein
LKYYGVLDYNYFLSISKKKQIVKIWKMAYHAFQECAHFLNNNDLLTASKYAYEKGIEIDYNTDLEVLKVELNLYNETYNASILITTDDEGMKANLILMKGQHKVYY